MRRWASNSTRWARSLGLAISLAAPTSAHAAVWGGFDSTRVNYAGGVLATGADHSMLRSVIMANGDTIAPPTGTLDAAYLSTVDVFYTSLLSSGGPVLTAAEQTALVDWVNAGGTLIATGGSSAGYFPSYDAFTSPFGVTGWAVTGASTATVVAVHPLTAGIVNLDPNAQATFSYGVGAVELATDDAGGPFMVVLDPDTGYCDGGRVLVLGDHNLFDDNGIALADNLAMATNMITWAAAPFGCGVCGNSILEPGEGCDDGNLDDTDACTSLCEPATCGDGFVQAGVEACDDGNLEDTDACLSTCVDASCGDGVLWAGMETCDDGNADDTDDCPSSCEPATCGDGFVQAGVEECDDGNADDTDACLGGCVLAVCGDTFVQAGVEECDDGNRIDDDGCTNDCMLPGAGTTGADTTGGGTGDATTGGVDGTGDGSGGSGGDDSGGPTGGDGSGGPAGTGDDGPLPGLTTGEGVPEDPVTCTCRTDDTPARASWLALLALLGLRRRRRQPTRPIGPVRQ